jgi:hypothetical protein
MRFFTVILSLFLALSSFASQISLLDTQKYAKGAGFKLNPKTADEPLTSAKDQQQMAKQYLQQLFAVWQPNFIQTQQNKIKVNMANRRQLFLMESLYGMNYKKYPATIMRAIFQKADNAVPVKQHQGIVVRESNLRAIPSLLPMFENYKKAGNGYPFDMNQAQKLWVGLPVAIVDRTSDGRWDFIITKADLGWVDSRDIATASQHFIHSYKTHKFSAIVKDGVPYTYHGHFLFDTRIGQVFPVEQGRLIIPIAGFDQVAKMIIVTPQAESFVQFPWSMTPAHMMQLINRMLGEPYDWGAQYNYRDCSLTMMSLFAPFGLYLPRASYQQKFIGKYIDMAFDANAKKKELVKSEGKPFLTLLGLEGHVMLYLGHQNGQYYVFQDKWGLDTHQNGRAGRAIIGEEVITPLSIGLYINHVNKPLWSSVLSMTLLPVSS